MPLQSKTASHWKPYLENLHVCMTDATCYKSHMRFPTGIKLLWESIKWLYKISMSIAGSLASGVRVTSMRMWRSPICPTARKERGRLQGRGCLNAVWSGFLKNSLYSGMRSIKSTEPHCGIPGITGSVFPSSGRSLYRKRNCLKGEKSLMLCKCKNIISFSTSVKLLFGGRFFRYSSLLPWQLDR